MYASLNNATIYAYLLSTLLLLLLDPLLLQRRQLDGEDKDVRHDKYDNRRNEGDFQTEAVSLDNLVAMLWGQRSNATNRLADGENNLAVLVECAKKEKSNKHRYNIPHPCAAP
jgi:hypothetical protein